MRQRYRRRADALGLLVWSLIAARQGYRENSSSLSLRAESVSRFNDDLSSLTSRGP